MRDNIAPFIDSVLSMATKAKSFESQLAELEQIVEKLEDGELTLEESLAQFEKGVKLTKACQKTLDTAQQKVEVLTKDNQLSDLHPED